MTVTILAIAVVGYVTAVGVMLLLTRAKVTRLQEDKTLLEKQLRDERLRWSDHQLLGHQWTPERGALTKELMARGEPLYRKGARQQ